MIPKHPAVQVLSLNALAIALILIGCARTPTLTQENELEETPTPTPTPVVTYQPPDPDPAVLRISPDSVPFGFIQDGKMEEKLVMLRNASGSQATAIAITVSDSARYVIRNGSPACAPILLPGDSCQIKLVGKGIGNAPAPAATLKVRYNDGFEEKSFTIALSSIGSTHGKLDSTFGTSGKVRGLTTIDDHFERALVVETIGEAANERIYIGGGKDVPLIRLKMDGDPDPQFGKQGLAAKATGHPLEVLNVQPGPNDSVVSMGRANGEHLFLARHKEDGTVDQAFDNNKTTLDEGAGAKAQNNEGIVYVSGVEPSTSSGLNTTLQQLVGFSFKDGNDSVPKLLVVAKKKNSNEARLIRMSPNGGGNSPIEHLALAGFHNAGYNLEIRAQNLGTGATQQKFFVIRGQEPVNADFAGRTVIARYKNLLTLTPDSAFGTAGKVVLNRCGIGSYSAMVTSANFIYVVLPGCIVRLLASNGAKDSNFGVGGVLALPNQDDIRSITIKNNLIYFLGRKVISAKQSVVKITRSHLETAKRDMSFGTDGTVEIAFDSNKPKNSVGTSMAFQNDGHLLVLGTSEGIFDGSDSDVGKGNLFGCIARLLP